MNYRKFYKEYYQINFDKNYEVHHLDENRENNNIENLLLLPKHIHHQYHQLKIFIENNLKMIGNINIQSYLFYPTYYYYDNVENWIKVKQECDKWFDYKMYLNKEKENTDDFMLIDKNILVLHNDFRNKFKGGKK